ncbi:hypothetical protein SAMN04488137_2639 [Fictibacillus solisalsi]|uniref:Uncharacterized protein n=1 Tax=Fictibacillus solisalsi TaxID=459525 RepID=A0A1G9X9U4_9BACL|nr:hypothetical protein [Fictibacillus solisalsi]SDM93085.1 hypothetical protein SAMN04488137_2639 [Fictibacillus solisalsi]
MESLKEKRRKERQRTLKTRLLIILSFLILSGCGTFAYAESSSIKDYLSNQSQQILGQLLARLQPEMKQVIEESSTDVQQTVQNESIAMNQEMSAYANLELERYKKEVKKYEEQKKQSIKRKRIRSEAKAKQAIRQSTNEKIEEAQKQIDQAADAVAAGQIQKSGQ